MSTSSGWLIAKATVLANESAGMAMRHRILRMPSATIGLGDASGSSVATAPGEMIVVRMLYGFTSWRSPSESTRTACLVAE